MYLRRGKRHDEHVFTTVFGGSRLSNNMFTFDKDFNLHSWRLFTIAFEIVCEESLDHTANVCVVEWGKKLIYIYMNAIVDIQ